MDVNDYQKAAARTLIDRPGFVLSDDDTLLVEIMEKTQRAASRVDEIDARSGPMRFFPHFLDYRWRARAVSRILAAFTVLTRTAAAALPVGLAASLFFVLRSRRVAARSRRAKGHAATAALPAWGSSGSKCSPRQTCGRGFRC
jgi:hypothetical protein